MSMLLGLEVISLVLRSNTKSLQEIYCMSNKSNSGFSEVLASATVSASV